MSGLAGIQLHTHTLSHMHTHTLSYAHPHTITHVHHTLTHVHPHTITHAHPHTITRVYHTLTHAHHTLSHAHTITCTPCTIEGFGNATRIDYGTGHEAKFMAFLCCLMKIGVILREDAAAVVLRVVKR